MQTLHGLCQSNNYMNFYDELLLFLENKGLVNYLERELLHKNLNVSQTFVHEIKYVQHKSEIPSKINEDEIEAQKQPTKRIKSSKHGKENDHFDDASDISSQCISEEADFLYNLESHNRCTSLEQNKL
jgi:hypothetical protein